MIVVPDGFEKNHSEIMIVLKPILILCKCFGVCSLPIFKHTRLSEIKHTLFSSGTAYQVIFLIFSELIYDIYKPITYSDRINYSYCSHYLMIVLFIVGTLTDDKLLDAMVHLEASDALIRPLTANAAIHASKNGYRWVFCALIAESYMFFFVYCARHECGAFDVWAAVFRQMPFLLSVALFSCLSAETCKRLQRLRSVLEEDAGRLDDPRFLEECRNVHCRLAMSAESFCEANSARVTLQLLLITMHTVVYFCYPCLRGGEGCELTYYIRGVVQQAALVTVICHYAASINENVCPLTLSLASYSMSDNKATKLV